MTQNSIHRDHSPSILIIQTAFIGDVVLTTPLIRSIAMHFPGAAIHVLVTPQTADILLANPHIEKVIVYDKRARDKSMAASLRLIGDLRTQRYEMAFLPHRSLRSAWLAYGAGIPERTGFSRKAASWLYSKRVPYDRGVHEAERYLRLLLPFTSDSFDATPEVFYRPQEEEETRRFLAEHVQADPSLLVAMAPGSVWATKRWFAERFAEVANRLQQELHASVVLFGGQTDRPLCEHISAMMDQPAIVAAGRLSLLQSAALLATCRVVLSNDTGLMHIAAAVKVPVVAIFGPTVPEFGFYPFGPGHTIVQTEIDCRPCGAHGARRCARNDFACMRRIGSEEVYETVLASLRKHQQ